jgi:hypothetical protein
LLEAVKRAFVTEREVVRLGLEANFNGIERIFNVFACYAGNLSYLISKSGIRGGHFGKY